MMKKFLVLLLSFTLLLSIIVTPVSAGNVTDFTVRVGDTAATAGDDRVAVDILLEGNPGIAGFSFCIDYDMEKLVLVESEINIEDGYKVIARPTGYGVNFAWTGPSGYSKDGKIATLYFNIPKNLTASEANIDIVYREGYDSFYDSHEHDIAVKTVNGKISIAALQETDKPSVNIDGVSVNFGATDIVVPITVENNPGFSGFSFCVNYDTRCLVLESTNILIDGGYKVIGHPEGYAVNIGWTSTEAYTQDGTIAELHFSLKDNANPGKSYIRIDFREDYDSFYSFVNGREEDIAFDAFSGYVDINNHQFGEWVITTPATCTSTGLKTRVCSDCSETETVVIPKSAHEYVSVVTAPTCIAKGYTTHTCKTCLDCYVDTYVDMVDHTHGDWEVRIAPECEVKGEEIQKCTVCKTTVNTRIINETGHDFDDWFVVLAAKFNEDGQERRDCKNCDHYETKRIPKLSEGHICDYTGAEEIIKDATCTTNGSKKVYCNTTGCGQYIIVDIATVGHTEGEWEVKQSSTCTVPGTKVKKCTICGEELQFASIDVVGHSYSTEWTIDVVPDCTTDGSKSHHCSVCGDKTDITTIVAPGHNYVWEYNYEDKTKTGICSVCGAEIIVEILEADVLTFTLNSDGKSYSVTDCKADYKGSVEIPATYKGLPVTAIGADAFRDCALITSVVIPDSVKSIGGSAFRDCTNLTEIVLPDKITSIPGAMCFGCKNLESVAIPDGIKTVGGYAFSNCSSLKYVFYEKDEASWSKITFGSSNAPLTEAAIHFNSDGEHVYSEEWTIDVAVTCTEDGLKSHHCTSCELKTDITVITATGHSFSDEWVIDASATCTSDGSKSHHCANCGEKTDITPIEATGHNYVAQSTNSVHPHKITYECSFCEDIKTENSVISDCVECNFTITAIDSSSYKLVSYIGTESDVKISSTYNGCAITTIANACFRGNSSVTSVEIAEGVTTIGSLAFMNCTSLKKIVIPASVNSIGAQAFWGFTGTIYCTKGSFAHEYAVSNNIKYVIMSIWGFEDTVVDYDNFIIRTTVQGCNDIFEILDVSDSSMAIPTASYIYGNLELYGTGTIITVFDGNDYIGDFTLIVDSDTNGDSICDVLDCFDVERASNGNAELSGTYAIAADSNSDNTVDITDYQAIVNKALAS